ncbi:MAG: acetylxylan esterase, partial [Steroidobacteraceae bacterium]
PADGEADKVNGATLVWHALDTANYNVNLYHFAWALSKPTSNVLFWVQTTVDSPREMQNVRLAIGSNAASRWWLNGEQVIALNDDRQTVIDDGVSRRITLHKGRNVIIAAIINGGGATDFCARFLDEDDMPIRGLQVSLK